MCLKDVCKIKNIKCLIRMGVVRYPPVTDFITHKNLLFIFEHMINGFSHKKLFIDGCFLQCLQNFDIKCLKISDFLIYFFDTACLKVFLVKLNDEEQGTKTFCY